MTPTAQATAYADQVGEEVARNLKELGVGDPGEGPEKAGRRLALVLAAETLWQEQLGPLLKSHEAREALGGVSRAALGKAFQSGRLLRLRDERGRIRYPAWQFDPAAQSIRPGVAEVLALFGERGGDEWEVATFFTNPSPELKGERPVSLLAAPGSADTDAVERLLTAAQRTVARQFD